MFELLKLIELIDKGDKIIVNHLHSLLSEEWTEAMKLLTQFGVEWVILLFLVVLIAMLSARFKKEACFLMVTTGGGLFFPFILKEIFKRARPVLENPIMIIHDYSFPSAHSFISICFYGALIYLLNLFHKDSAIIKVFSLFLAILIVFIGFSRIYLGVHYPTDVIGGFLLGYLWLKICITAFQKAK